MNSSAALTRLAAFVCAASTVFLAGCSDNRSYSPSSPTPFPVANGGTPAAGGQSAKPLDEYGDDAPMPQPEPPPPAPSLTIVITSRNGAQSFLPNPADAAGQFVVFRNADSILHRVVLNDGTIDTGNIAPGATSVPVLMPATGTNYHCALHPDMVGSVTTPAGTPPPGGEPPPSYEPPPYEPPPYYYQLP
jgi:plastocyanin